MNERKIFCAGCNKYLGVIRNATLRKEIVHLCAICNTKRIASDLAKGTAERSSIDDIKDIFGL